MQGTLAGISVAEGDTWSEERSLLPDPSDLSDLSDTPTVPGGWDEASGERTMTVGEALAGSRFTLAGERDASGANVALWGRGAQSRFDARAGATDLDGTLMTGMLGADYGTEDWLGGMALVWSDGEGGYRAARGWDRARWRPRSRRSSPTDRCGRRSGSVCGVRGGLERAR